MAGILYGVGVGPGDPELLTLKAARVLRECDAVAAPDPGSGESVALSVAEEHIGDKPVLLCPMPMVRGKKALRKSREAAADRLCAQLDEGKNVAFLTLGDPAIYSTYLYLHRIVAERGYRAEFIPGVPSFCAAAAALGEPLCEGSEALHILPASCPGEAGALMLGGTKVFLKAGTRLTELVDELKQRDLLDRAMLAGRVGLPGETLTRDLGEPPEDSGYLSLVIVKEKSHG